jgi:hypothetical protein
MKRLSWLLAACLAVAVLTTSAGKATAQAPIVVQPVPVAAGVPVEMVAYPYKKAWKYATGRAPARAYYGPRRAYAPYYGPYYRGPRGPRVVIW